MTASSNERAAALAALTFGIPVDGGAGETEAPALERTGNEVYAGGDVARLLIMDAPTLGYVEGGLYQRAEAVPGDVVLLTQKQADRLDALGATVDPSTPDEEVEEVLTDPGAMTDEQIAAMGAADAIAYVTQHPDERERVLAIELAKPEGKGKGTRRVSVLKAAEPQPEAEAEAQAQAQAAQQDPGAVHGPTAEQVAESQQDNDATTGE